MPFGLLGAGSFQKCSSLQCQVSKALELQVMFPHSIGVVGFPTEPSWLFFCSAPWSCGKEPLRSMWVVGFLPAWQAQPGFPNAFLLGCFLQPLRLSELPQEQLSPVLLHFLLIRGMSWDVCACVHTGKHVSERLNLHLTWLCAALEKCCPPGLPDSTAFIDLWVTPQPCKDKKNQGKVCHQTPCLSPFYASFLRSCCVLHIGAQKYFQHKGSHKPHVSTRSVPGLNLNVPQCEIHKDSLRLSNMKIKLNKLSFF